MYGYMKLQVGLLSLAEYLSRIRYSLGFCNVQANYVTLALGHKIKHQYKAKVWEILGRKLKEGAGQQTKHITCCYLVFILFHLP